MKKFISRHIILLIGAALLLIFPEHMASYGFLIVILYAVGAWVPVLIINAAAFAVYKAGTEKCSKKLLNTSLLLSFMGGALGIYIARWFGYYSDDPQREKTILTYALELNIFVLAVLPLFVIITDEFLKLNLVDFSL